MQLASFSSKKKAKADVPVEEVVIEEPLAKVEKERKETQAEKEEQGQPSHRARSRERTPAWGVRQHMRSPGSGRKFTPQGTRRITFSR